MSEPVHDLPDLFAPGADTATPLSQPFAATPTGAMVAAFGALALQHAARLPVRRTRLMAMAVQIAPTCCARPGRRIAYPHQPQTRGHSGFWP